MSDIVVLQKDYQNGNTIYKGNNFYYVLGYECELSTLSLPQSFGLGGTYIFGNFNGITISIFYARLLEYLHKLSCQVAFLWIENPEMDVWKWRYQWISCFIKNADSWKLGTYAEFKFGAYRLALSGDMFISCENNKMIFHTSGENENSYLFRLSEINGVPTSDEFSLDFSMGEEGVFRFNIRLAGDGVSDVFERMDANLKYCAPLGSNVLNSWKQGNVGMISCPVLHSVNNLILQVKLNPSLIYDHEKTFLSLFNTTSDNFFDSALINVSGHLQRIQASTSSRLVFEKIPRYIYYDMKNQVYCGEQTYYLGFSGTFSLEKPEKHILCGLSGMEFMDLTKADSLEINFESKQNSFFGEQSQQNLSTTAWLSFPNNTGYFSQPEVAPMYCVNDQNMLRFMEIPTVQLDQKVSSVPVVFYKKSKVSFLDKHSIEEIERRIYGTRYQLITGRVVEKEGGLVSVRGDVCQKTVTPQGLMAGVVPSTGSYEWFGIAQTNVMEELPNIRFCNVSESLRMEFQNSKLFLLKDNKDIFLKEAQPSGDFKVLVDDWCFLLSPEDWKSNAGDKNTAFIVKYMKGKSVYELLHDSTIFQASLKEAYDQHQVVLPQYQSFVRKVQDPDFQGIIFLNPPVSVTQIPKEVTFLLRGVKQEDFFAHHVILEGNKVNQDIDGDLHMEESSVEALIDYKNGSQIVYDENMPDYSFSTVEITLTIENSAITHLSSVSEILINRLYGAISVKNNTTSGNCMILDGVSQKKDNEVEYSFSLREAGVYSLIGSAMEVMEIQWAVLAVDHSKGNNGRIVFGGNIQFPEMLECDLLSYQMLVYSNLVLVIPDSGELYMEYDKLALNYSDSILREQSFGNRFSCQLKQIVYTEGQMPDDIGYQSITTPIRQSKISSPWAGLVWNVSLGSMGDLSDSGEVNIQLLIGWSMGEKVPAYYIGVLLPSIMTGFDVQGIVKLGFQSVELMVSQEEEKQSYTLRLHNYTLRLLWLSIPPGSNDLFIFSDGKKLGWYAAYVGEES